jgi:hypothetical protein
LPLFFPALRDAETFVGWFDPASRPFSLLSRTGGHRVLPPVKMMINAVLHRLFRGSSGGPDAQDRFKYRTVVVAEAYDGAGRQVSRAVLEGLNPYDFTGEMLAWAADRVANVGVNGVGALGPINACGLGELAEGVRQAGIERTE